MRTQTEVERDIDRGESRYLGAEGVRSESVPSLRHHGSHRRSLSRRRWPRSWSPALSADRPGWRRRRGGPSAFAVHGGRQRRWQLRCGTEKGSATACVPHSVGSRVSAPASVRGQGGRDVKAQPYGYVYLHGIKFQISKQRAGQTIHASGTRPASCSPTPMARPSSSKVGQPRAPPTSATADRHLLVVNPQRQGNRVGPEGTRPAEPHPDDVVRLRPARDGSRGTSSGG